MKTPDYLITRRRIIVIFLLLVGIAIALYKMPQLLKPGKYAEEEEGIPASLEALDLWGDMRSYPFKQMPAERFSEAYQEGKRMEIKKRLSNARQQNINIPPPWTPLGPMNFAGRILCLAFHPTNPNIIWAGSASGGLWKTTVGGSTGVTGFPAGIAWQNIQTGFPVLGVGAIAINPSNPNEMYVGTGEVYFAGVVGSGVTGSGHVRTFRGSYGIGIIKTTDGGTTWSKTLDFSYSSLKGVSEIVIDAANPSIVFAATTDGVYRTRDAGANWQLVLNVPMATDLVYQPGSSTVLYAACGNFGSTGTGIYKTTDANNISTPSFTQLAGGLPTGITGKIQLAVTPANVNWVMASIGNEPNGQAPPEGLYRSTNNGTTWAGLRTGAASIITNQGWYAHDVAIDPTNANFVYWGELNLYRSTVGGGSPFVMSDWSYWYSSAFDIGADEGDMTAYVHADIHRIYATAANTIYICTDGGIFKSTDAAVNFKALNGGLQTTQLYSKISISQQDPNYMLAGLQDNGALVYEGAPNCRKLTILGDGTHTAIDPTNDAKAYVESYYLRMQRSFTKGGPWNPYINNDTNINKACFNAPFVLAPSNAATMYTGTTRIWKTTDGGASGNTMNGGLSISNDLAPCIYIAVAPTDENTIYVSTAPGGGARSKLWRSRDGGNSFTDISASLPDRYYSSIDVDPIDPDRVVVTLSGFTPLASESQIYLSHDGGDNWSNIGNNLPDVPHNMVHFDPTDRGALYVGTDIGLFYGNGLPTSGVLGPTTYTIWTGYNDGLGDGTMISDLAFTNTTPIKLRLATYGRGLWERELAPMNLPVVFKNFSVTVGDRGNNLKWIVSEQTNVSRYEVEYSTNASNFKVLTSILATPGAGEISYTYLHGIRNGVNGYYRIKSIDYDGKVSYSHIEEVKSNNLVTNLTAYPNPTMGILKVQVPTTIGSTFNLSVYDASGRLVFKNKYQKLFGVDISVNLMHIPSGSYQVVCEDQQGKYTTRILKR